MGDDFYRGNDGKNRGKCEEWNQAYMRMMMESGSDVEGCWPLLRLDEK